MHARSALKPLDVLGHLLSLPARRRRAHGRYDRRTLAGLHTAWRCSRSPTSLLALASFRRDLGRRLPARWCAPLLAALPRLSARQRDAAIGLVGEVDAARLEAVPTAMLRSAAASVPVAAAASTPAAAAASASVADSKSVAGATPAARTPDAASASEALARVHREHPARRDAFAAWARSCATAGGLCVVGNAGDLRGRGLGGAIDRHDGVVRFNAYRADASKAADLGRRIDVWVAAQSFSGCAPAAVDWAVMTGPDPLYRSQHWSRLLALEATGVTRSLTVPLFVWRALVAELAAPPSAGVLMLAWLRTALGDWRGLRCAGLGTGAWDPRAGRYHVSDATQAASARHHWLRERALLARWEIDGLVRLDAGTNTTLARDAAAPASSRGRA